MHRLEPHAVGIGEEHRVIFVIAVVAVGRIGNRHAVLVEERAEIVHGFAARELEGVVMKTDIALAMLALASLRVGLPDPEQCLAVAPAREAAAVVRQLEAEEAEHLAVERLRAREVAHAEHQVINAGDTGHGRLLTLDASGTDMHPNRRNMRQASH